MDAFLQQFQDLKIRLEEITSATDNFNDAKNCIGVGGFGKVYKGELVSHSNVVAIKRLDPKHGQGIPEFLKEITALSRYRHENLISFLGFCHQGDEAILVYEHASHGSLDRHLSSPHLTWSQRIKICLDAAKGISYLHDPRDTHQRLIHCDIKSANILLDDQWIGKVSDFGLSIMGPANEQQSVIVTMAAGTHGYCDPVYSMTHTLTKESDVYSFGVVLFEVLCGTLCCTYRDGRVQQILVPTWIERYKQNKLNDIIFKNPSIEPLDQSALETLSDIAYRCLKKSREDRPKMAEVVTELETALKSQEFGEGKLLFDYKEMIRTAAPSLNCSSKGELCKLLSKGVLLNHGKTWLSLNKKGEHREIVSFSECLDPGRLSKSHRWSSAYNSRFAVGVYRSYSGILKTHVKAQFLSPGITYTVNLVFKIEVPYSVRKCQHLISLKYKLQGETKTSISYLAYEREDGWWMCELYQFTSDSRTIDLEILFDGFDRFFSNFIVAEGIEFWPLEEVDHKEDEKQPISDSDANWEQKLPTDYEDIMKLSKRRVFDYFRRTTKKEAYSVICKGFLTNDGKKWFNLDENGKKCLMLSAVDVCDSYGDKLPLPESRFGEAFVFDDWGLAINTRIQSQLVTSETTYAAYLVYKFQKDQTRFEAPLEVIDESCDLHWYIYLASPQTPVIRPKAGQNAYNSQNRPKIRGLPRQRNDGWMEVQIWEFQTSTTTDMIRMRLKLISLVDRGVIIEGVELRPT